MGTFTFTHTVGQVSAGTFVPITSTAYHLRVSPYSGNTYSATSDANGLLAFGTIADGWYRLYDNAGSQVTSFGERFLSDDATTWVTVTTTTSVITDTIAERTAAAGVTIDGVLIKDSLNASSIMALTGDQTAAGVKTFSSFPITPSSAPSTDYEVANKKFVVDLSLIPVNKLYVCPDFTGVAGKTYTSIGAALTYANSQSPSATSKWDIYIYPSKHNANGYSENISLQAHVNLIGVGLVKIIGSISGAATTIKLENLYWVYDGNFSLTSVVAYNCIFVAYQSVANGGRILTVTSSKLYNCGLYAYAGTSPTITSGGSNVFINCYANAALNLESTDKGSVLSLNDATVNFDY